MAGHAEGDESDAWSPPLALSRRLEGGRPQADVGELPILADSNLPPLARETLTRHDAHRSPLRSR